MTTLIRVDFTQKKVVGRYQLAELAEPTGISYKCECCQQSYSTDKASGAYCESVSWQIKTKSGKIQDKYLCKHCIDAAYHHLNGGNDAS